jgi:hypothetical protein
MRWPPSRRADLLSFDQRFEDVDGLEWVKPSGS